MKMTKIIALLVISGLMQAAFAKDFQERHPRRAEVNERVRDQRKQIGKDLKAGKITPAQAQQLRSQLDGVKGEEKAEVKANGGHLTKPEQKQLNQELNQDHADLKNDAQAAPVSN